MWFHKNKRATADVIRQWEWGKGYSMLFFMVVGEAPERKKPVQAKIDENLILRIGQDDRDALEELYCLTERSLYSYVLAMVRNPYDTQDIVQDTYLKIRAAAHLYEPQGKPMAWIFTIARNLSMNQLNAGKRQIYPEEGQMENDLQYSYIEDPTDRLVLEAAFKILKEQERQIIFLHLVAGMKHREIARLLHQPLSTVLSCYNRALKKLRVHMSEGGSRNEKRR